MAENLGKRPRKGILKNSSSFDTQEAQSAAVAKKSKETKWDEMNIIATYHPADKDYGHMKIEEPKTPYNYVDPEGVDVLDATQLAEKIKLSAEKPPKAMRDSEEDSEEEEEILTAEELEKRKEFENKRKMHYNEFYAVKLARKLLEEEEEEGGEGEKEKENENEGDKN